MQTAPAEHASFPFVFLFYIVIQTNYYITIVLFIYLLIFVFSNKHEVYPHKQMQQKIFHTGIID
jgi:hypothetical protein